MSIKYVFSADSGVCYYFSADSLTEVWVQVTTSFPGVTGRIHEYVDPVFMPVTDKTVIDATKPSRIEKMVCIPYNDSMIAVIEIPIYSIAHSEMTGIEKRMEMTENGITHLPVLYTGSEIRHMILERFELSIHIVDRFANHKFTEGSRTEQIMMGAIHTIMTRHDSCTDDLISAAIIFGDWIRSNPDITEGFEFGIWQIYMDGEPLYQRNVEEVEECVEVVETVQHEDEDEEEEEDVEVDSDQDEIAEDDYSYFALEMKDGPNIRFVESNDDLQAIITKRLASKTKNRRKFLKMDYDDDPELEEVVTFLTMDADSRVDVDIEDQIRFFVYYSTWEYEEYNSTKGFIQIVRSDGVEYK